MGTLKQRSLCVVYPNAGDHYDPICGTSKEESVDDVSNGHLGWHLRANICAINTSEICGSNQKEFAEGSFAKVT